jgi:hypothetical protein
MCCTLAVSIKPQKQSRMIVSIGGLDWDQYANSNPGIEPVGTVVYDLSGVVASKLQSVVKDGVTHYVLNLVLNIRLDDDSGHLVFRILHEGKEVGKAGIDISDS